MFGIMHFLTVIIGNSGFYDYTINKASIFVILFTTLYLITRVIITNRSNIRSYINFRKIEYKQDVLFNFLLILLIICFILKIVNFMRFTGGLLNSSWGEYREYSLNLDYVNGIKIVDILFFSLSGLLLGSFFYGSKIKFILLSLMFTTNAIIFRHRIAILPILCSFIAIYISKIERINILNLVSFLIMSFMVIYVVYGLRVLRYYGTIDNLFKQGSFQDFNSRIANFIINSDGELSLRKIFYYFIEHDNNFVGFGKGSTYKRMLFVFIPTQFSFGLKPEDFAITMGSAVGMRYLGSVHPTLFGDAYANFGYYGIFIGIFWAIYVSIVDRNVNSRSSILWTYLHYILNSMYFVLIGRGSVYNSFFTVVYGTLILLILEFISNHFAIKRNRHGKLHLYYIN